jgi:hypothetical protein
VRAELQPQLTETKDKAMPTPISSKLKTQMHNKKIRRKILRFVRQTAKMYGVKVVWDSSDPTISGSFLQTTGRSNPGIISLTEYGTKDGKTLVPSTDNEVAETALHELAHVMQSARGDKSFNFMLPHKGELYPLQSARIDFEEGNVYFTARQRCIILLHIMRTEREAEEFSILMMQSLGYIRPKSRAYRSANSSLLQHILILRYGLLITARQSDRLRVRLTKTKVLGRYEIISLTPELLSKLDEIVGSSYKHLRQKCVAYWHGNDYVRNSK